MYDPCAELACAAPHTRTRAQVPPVSAAEVRATLERQYGKPVDQVFEEFSFVPLAAASLGQVHFAKVGGKRVVVKVQRPGLRALFDVDLKNVRVIAQWLQVRFAVRRGCLICARRGDKGIKGQLLLLSAVSAPERG